MSAGGAAAGVNVVFVDLVSVELVHPSQQEELQEQQQSLWRSLKPQIV